MPHPKSGGYSRKIAEEYDSDPLTILGGLVERQKRRELLWMHGISLKGKSVCCIGCGTGRDAYEIMQEYCPGQVDASDYSEHMVTLAKRKYGRKISFEVKNAEFLEGVKADNYDFVNCSLAINFVENHAAAIKEMFRICKPGGHVLIAVVDVHKIGDQDIEKTTEYRAFDSPAWKRPRKAYCDAIVGAGGKIIDEAHLVTSGKALGLSRDGLLALFYREAGYMDADKARKKEIETVFKKSYANDSGFAWGWMVLARKL